MEYKVRRLKGKSFPITATAMILVISAIIVPFLTPELAKAFENIASTETSSAYPEWQLTVTGCVNNPLNLSLGEIIALPQTSVNAEIVCVDYPDEIILYGNWTGVKLRLLLEKAEISPQALKVAFYDTGYYSTDLNIETAMHGDVILAYQLNGMPLDEVIRLVVPGKWGYKWIHHIERIEIYDYDFLGYWESRGYSDEADMYAPSEPAIPSVPSGPIPEFPSWIILPLFLIVTVVVIIYRNKFRRKS